jgi:N-acyl-D-aspartate/D-glutamate deacylase
VTDNSTLDRPTAPSSGIDLVMINGEIVYRYGVMTEARPGRIVRRGAP